VVQFCLFGIVLFRNFHLFRLLASLVSRALFFLHSFCFLSACENED
jgi:hypothetical protein